MKNAGRALISSGVAIALCLAASLVVRATVAAEPVARVRVEMRSPAGEVIQLPEAARLVVRPAAGDGEEIEIEPGSVVDLPPGEELRICLESAAFWAACQAIPAAAAPEVAQVVLTAWPAATLAGRLRLADPEPEEMHLPETLRVTVGPPPGPGAAGALSETAFDCPVNEKGAFRCMVPATPLFAALRASGFVSRFFWDLEPAPGGTIRLGTVTLERGASLTGSVDLQTPGLDSERITVRLSPAVGVGTSPAAAARLETTAPIGGVSDHGFFQLAGIEPGAYMLQVSHPSFATTSVGPVEVYPGKETELRFPVTLSPPIQVEVVVTPPSSPAGKPWRLRVFRERDWSTGSDSVFQGAVDAAGVVRIPGQSPGTFGLSVEDDAGNRFYSGMVRIEPGGSGFVPVEVPVVAVEGELRLGDAPLAGTLVFGGRQGALRSRMVADEEGRFQGVLPRGGEWEVEIEGADPALETVTRVEVDPGNDGTAEIDIELPDTEVVGRVVDAEGRPVPDAGVRAESTAEPVHRNEQTDERGEFHFRALPAGQVVVTAWRTVDGRRAVSQPARVGLQEEVVAGPVELVLREMATFSGRVLTATGPAPGVRIQAATVGLPIPAVSSAVTDEEGRFELQLPGSAKLLAINLLPPGRYLTTTIVAAEEALELRAAERGGTLVVAPAGEGGGSLGNLTVERDGVLVGPVLLHQWVRSHGQHPGAGGPTVIPRLEEGQYRVCRLSDRLRRETLRGGGTWQDLPGRATDCDEGYLPAGGTLELAPGAD